MSCKFHWLSFLNHISNWCNWTCALFRPWQHVRNKDIVAETRVRFIYIPKLVANMQMHCIIKYMYNQRFVEIVDSCHTERNKKKHNKAVNIFYELRCTLMAQACKGKGVTVSYILPTPIIPPFQAPLISHKSEYRPICIRCLRTSHKHKPSSL